MVEMTRTLSPPKFEHVRYKKNFIKTAVCELRFPTLLELETKPPRELQARIRKAYPFYESQIVEQIGAPEGLAQEQSYLFRSKDKDWTVTVKSSAIALETSKYYDFEDFYKRFEELLHHAAPMIDSDFFTRVGLRYINSVPISTQAPEEWIRSDLIQPIISGVLGFPSKYAAIAHGNLERGKYSFRHGIKDSEPQADNFTYNLDFDYYDENVEFVDVAELIHYFNEVNFDFFNWCIGNSARDLLGEGSPK